MEREALNEQDGVDEDVLDTAAATETEQDDAATEPVGSADVAGTMRWSEFNRRSRELEREREAMVARERELQARAAGYQDYEEFKQTLADNPDLAADIRAAFERHGPRTQSRAGVPAEVTRELTAMRSELSETRMELLANRIQTEADRLQREHGLSAEETQNVVKQALEDGLLDHKTPRDLVGKRLTTVYRSMSFEKAKGAGQRELVTKLREGARAASPGGKAKGTDAPEPEPDYGKMSYEEIARHEMKRLGVNPKR